jgi:hypothetical protein
LDRMFCAAVDTAGQAATWNGASWSNPTTIDQNLDPYYRDSVVSCTRRSFCVALVQGAQGGDSVVYDGASWSTPTTIEPVPNRMVSLTLNSVSCVGSDFCIAVDSEGGYLWAGPS